MRIGLFPYKKHRVGNSITSRTLVRKNVAIAEIHELEEKDQGRQQELKMGGATVQLRNLTLDNLAAGEYENAHFCYGIHFLLEGDCKFTSAEGQATVGVKSGYYNLVQWPNILGTVNLKGTECVSVEVFFTRDFIEDLLGSEHDSVFRHFLDSSGKHPQCLWDNGQPIPGKLRILLLEILNCPYRGNARVSYIESQTRCLLIEAFLGRENCMGKIGEPQLPSLDYEAIERVVSYIKMNLKKKLTIKELSEIAGFNTTKLKSSFKKVHQTTIFKYITQLRMEKARMLVLQENLTIAQASYEVGYSNPQHFTVAFKKTMGYLPSSLLGAPL